LIDDEDRDWFTSNVKEVLTTQLKVNFDDLFGYLDRNMDGKIDDHELHALMFCDFVDVKSDPRPYLEVTEPDKVRKTVEGFLDEFNNMSKKPMNLVLFRYKVFTAISHDRLDIKTTFFERFYDVKTVKTTL